MSNRKAGEDLFLGALLWMPFILFALIFSPRAIRAEDVGATVYPITSESFDAINIAEVANGFLTNRDLTSAFKKNPAMYGKLVVKKVATIVTRNPSPIGSIDPFTYRGRQEAAKIGSNLLVYESGTELKNTKETASVTFTAYRVLYRNVLVTPLLASQLPDVTARPELFESMVKEAQKKKAVEEAAELREKVAAEKVAAAERAAAQLEISSLHESGQMTGEELRSFFENLNSGSPFVARLTDGTEKHLHFSRFNGESVFGYPGGIPLLEQSIEFSLIKFAAHPEDLASETPPVKRLPASKN